MLTFTLINNFDHNKFYKYGINFKLQNNTTTFITSSGQTYKYLFNTIIAPAKNVIGQIHFDKYELLSLDYKTRARFIYDQLEIFNSDTFYNEKKTVYDFFKENWMLNHLNTRDFDAFYNSFSKELKIESWSSKYIKYLSREQKDIIGLSLALFNNKKYLIINKDCNSFNPYDCEVIANFLKYLNKHNITILWFTNDIKNNFVQFKQINLDDEQYDTLNKDFIVNDEAFLASKFTLTTKKWFKMTSIMFKKINIIYSLVYGFLATVLFMLSLFFSNKPITLFNQPIGIIKDDQTSLLVGVILLIALLVLTFIFSHLLYRKTKSYVRFLIFNGISRTITNYLICFIILIFACSVILSSYIILVITYSSFCVLGKVKWVSSIYFPISLLFFNIACCIMCASMIKNNLLETKIARTKRITKQKNFKNKESR